MSFWEYRRLIALLELDAARPDSTAGYGLPPPASALREPGTARRKSRAIERPMVMWIVDATLRPRARRPHRRTDKPVGRPIKNKGDKAAEAALREALASAIDRLVRLRGMKRTAARRLVAATLLDRVFKDTLEATWKTMDPTTSGGLSDKEWIAIESARHRLRRLLRK